MSSSTIALLRRQGSTLSMLPSSMSPSASTSTSTSTSTSATLRFMVVVVSLISLSSMLHTIPTASALRTMRSTSFLGRSSSLIRQNDGIGRKLDTSSSLSPLQSLVKIRGGSEDEVDSDDYEEDDDELDDEDDFFDEFELGDEADDDFAEESTVDRLVDAYHKTPPLTKGYLTASALITGAGWAFNGNKFPELFMLNWAKTFKRGQIWRPFTTFFNFGPMGLGYLLTVHFVWTYMSTLERLHHRKPYEFWIMIGFGMMSMVVGYGMMGLQTQSLGHNLSTFLVYMWSRYHEGMQVKMFEVHTTRAELLPWYFLLQTFLLEGEPPVLDFLGIVFGHIYHHCNTVGLLRAPESLQNWYRDSDSAKAIRTKYKEISSDFEVL